MVLVAAGGGQWIWASYQQAQHIQACEEEEEAKGRRWRGGCTSPSVFSLA